MTETAEMADVVFPATAWAETDGSCTNTDRRVQRLRAAVPPPGEAKPDWWIVSQLAKRMGFQGFDYESAADVFNELCALSRTYHGIDWDKISAGDHSYQWPIPFDGHPGTPRLHEKEFINGRGIFKLVRYRDPAETVDEEYPVWLTTGRRLASYHTRTQTGRAAGIDYLLPEEVLEVQREATRRGRGAQQDPDARSTHGAMLAPRRRRPCARPVSEQNRPCDRPGSAAIRVRSVTAPGARSCSPTWAPGAARSRRPCERACRTCARSGSVSSLLLLGLGDASRQVPSAH